MLLILLCWQNAGNPLSHTWTFEFKAERLEVTSSHEMRWQGLCVVRLTKLSPLVLPLIFDICWFGTLMIEAIWLKLTGNCESGSWNKNIHQCWYALPLFEACEHQGNFLAVPLTCMLLSGIVWLQLVHHHLAIHAGVLSGRLIHVGQRSRISSPMQACASPTHSTDPHLFSRHVYTDGGFACTAPVIANRPDIDVKLQADPTRKSTIPAFQCQSTLPKNKWNTEGINEYYIL